MVQSQCLDMLYSRARSAPANSIFQKQNVPLNSNRTETIGGCKIILSGLLAWIPHGKDEVITWKTRICVRLGFDDQRSVTNGNRVLNRIYIAGGATKLMPLDFA